MPNIIKQKSLEQQISPGLNKTIANALPEAQIKGKAQPCKQTFFHPDYTVGSGISPDQPL